MQRIFKFSHKGKGEVETIEASSHRGTGKDVYLRLLSLSKHDCMFQTKICSVAVAMRQFTKWFREGGCAQRATEGAWQLPWYEGQIKYYYESVIQTKDYCSRKVCSTQRATQWKTSSLVPLLMEQFVFFYVWMFGAKILWFYPNYFLLEQKVVPAVQHFTNKFTPWAHQSIKFMLRGQNYQQCNKICCRMRNIVCIDLRTHWQYHCVISKNSRHL